MTQIKDIDTEFRQLYDEVVAAVESSMEDYLSYEPGIPEILHEAMLYSIRAGGKRLRPAMVVLACTACGGQDSLAMPAAAAIEMVHTYSLIHDDLPVMDNDDFRRGKPTSHKVFGDGIAVLAGDALLTCAFNVLALHVKNSNLTGRLVLELTNASGAAGMIGGQVADLTWHNGPGDLEAVKYIHVHKTAMMFRAATRMGAICADADERFVDMLGDYGLKLGLAFQIIDDLLDLTATPEEMGKQTQKDQQAGKLTYPMVLGTDESHRQAQKLMDEAVAVIKPLGAAALPLRHLAGMLVNRKN